LFAGILFSKADEVSFIHTALPTALLVCFLYWQFIPVLMASMGSSLEMKKLLVYPIPEGEAFHSGSLGCAFRPALKCFCY